MEFSEKTASIKFPHDSVKSNSEVMKLSSNVDNYCEIYKELAENLDTMKPKEMAKHLNLTERRVRQIAKDVKEM